MHTLVMGASFLWPTFKQIQSEQLTEWSIFSHSWDSFDHFEDLNPVNLSDSKQFSAFSFQLSPSQLFPAAIHCAYTNEYLLYSTRKISISFFLYFVSLPMKRRAWSRASHRPFWMSAHLSFASSASYYYPFWWMNEGCDFLYPRTNNELVLLKKANGSGCASLEGAICRMYHPKVYIWTVGSISSLA